jgi:hypothetical protein
MPLAGPLVAALHSLAADIPAGRLQVHLCPRIALTAELPGASVVPAPQDLWRLGHALASSCLQPGCLHDKLTHSSPLWKSRSK